MPSAKVCSGASTLTDVINKSALEIQVWIFVEESCMWNKGKKKRWKKKSVNDDVT